MKKLKLLWMILKRTKATQILSGYIVFLFVSAAIIQLVEPDINRYGDALWYCYAVLSTAGFGDIVAMTFVGKLVSVLVTNLHDFCCCKSLPVLLSIITDRSQRCSVVKRQ
mgnify:CR=1 FL=1